MFFHQPEVILRLKHNLETFERIRMRFSVQKYILTRRKIAANGIFEIKKAIFIENSFNQEFQADHMYILS